MKKYFALFILLSLTLVGCHKKEEQPLETRRIQLVQSEALSNGSNDSLFVSLDVEYPIAMDNVDALQAIQYSLKEQLFGPEFIALQIDTAVSAFLDALVLEYRDNNLSLLEEEEMFEGELVEDIVPILSAQHILTAEVMSVQYDVMSYQIDRYIDNGGAHGQHDVLYYNYSVNTGEEVLLDDVFVESSADTLTTLILQSLAADLKMDVEELGRSEYKVEKIGPTDNFYFSEEGIVFVYNAYDIAPYSVGDTRVLVAWTAVLPILRANYQTPEED